MKIKHRLFAGLFALLLLFAISIPTTQAADTTHVTQPNAAHIQPLSSTDKYVSYVNTSSDDEYICISADNNCGTITSGGTVSVGWINGYTCLSRKVYGACDEAMFQQDETWFSVSWT